MYNHNNVVFVNDEIIIKYTKYINDKNVINDNLIIKIINIYK